MKRYNAAQARANLSSLLDAAEAGEPVVIERRGVRFRLETDKGRRPPRSSSVIEDVDPQVMEGNWEWQWGPDGLGFTVRREHS
jgi:antitoxin (DNA-binding transcriptional repressor) of toxin-antitoxin stability system